jgi:hypothetical protein
MNYSAFWALWQYRLSAFLSGQLRPNGGSLCVVNFDKFALPIRLSIKPFGKVARKVRVGIGEREPFDVNPCEQAKFGLVEVIFQQLAQ